MDDQVQLVVFQIGGLDYALEISQVERIIRYEPPVPLPKSPDFVEGVLPHDAAPVPIVDLRRRLEAPASLDEETRIMVVDTGQQRIGVVVDRVLEVIRVDSPAIAPPAMVGGLAAEFIAGMVSNRNESVVILHAGKLFTSKERTVLADAAAEA